MTVQSSPIRSRVPSNAMQMHIQIPGQQRLQHPYDPVAVHQSQQQAHAAAAAAQAAHAAGGYAFPQRRPSLPFGTEMFDPSAAQFRPPTQVDPLAQHFQPRGSISALSAQSSGSSPYTSASPMPSTPPSAMDQPTMLNPWLFPFALNAMGGLGVNPAHIPFWLGKPPPGRQRTNQACEKCRDRKTKCTGERPTCHRCAMRGLQCEYASEHRVRGPTKNRKRNAASVDLTSSGPPVSPTFSTPERAFQQAPLEGDAHGSPSGSTIAGSDDKWNKADVTSTTQSMFHDWMQQNNSSLGLSIPSNDAVKQEDVTGAFNEHIDPAIHAPDSSAAFIRYSASMPHLHLSYDFGQPALHAPVPINTATRQASFATTDSQPDVGADFSWTVPQFDQSQDFAQQLHLSRADDLGGSSPSNMDPMNFSSPTQTFSFAGPPRSSFANYSDVRSHESNASNRLSHDHTQPPAPVPSTNGYWFALAAKETRTTAKEPRLDAGEEQSHDASAADGGPAYSWATDDELSRSTNSDASSALPEPLLVSSPEHRPSLEDMHDSEQETSKDSLFDETPEMSGPSAS
ncbi:hypothetical protein EXIGLDRAFT_705969 [Exidia glandulosa HHB12029]|uniref:Zn(2)-C6 fungal-type domain-containing protein n=1 Tax=Exidia glandulosa HHB12029 TaxID=1314781 RepID=A0A165KDL0_EXIGL|nr:hypothetical protein EXIGLDRAFT_705969 [Exidia glandulosa HHB12029]